MMQPGLAQLWDEARALLEAECPVEPVFRPRDEAGNRHDDSMVAERTGRPTIGDVMGYLRWLEELPVAEPLGFPEDW